MSSKQNRSMRALIFGALLLSLSGAVAYWLNNASEPERIPASETHVESTGAPLAPSPELSQQINQASVTREEPPALPPEEVHLEASEKAPQKTVAVPTPTEEPPAPVVQASQTAVDFNPLVGLRAFLGFGLNYVQYSEQFEGISAKYRDFRGPSAHFGIEMDLTEKTTVLASYKSTPLHFDNSSAGLDPLAGVWQTLILQASSRVDRCENNEHQMKLLWGVQFHEIPLPLFKTADNSPVMRNVQSFNASLGLQRDDYLNPFTRTQVFLRAQYPMSSQASSSGGDLNSQSLIIFDGSVGVEKKIRPGYWVGLHWYGQYHKTKFKYVDPQINVNGDAAAFFSSVEARLVIEF